MNTPSSADDFTALLTAIQEQQQKYGFPIEPPATVAAIAALRSSVAAELGTELPAAYADFLARSNGLDWNGTVFFATRRREPTPEHRFLDGVVDANLDLRSDTARDDLALGESGMERYVFTPSTRSYRVVDTVSLDELERHPSFEALFTAVLRKRL